MAQGEYAELQLRYGGQYVARRDGEVVASAESYEKLIARVRERVETGSLAWSDIVIEYVDPATVIAIY